MNSGVASWEVSKSTNSGILVSFQVMNMLVQEKRLKVGSYLVVLYATSKGVKALLLALQRWTTPGRLLGAWGIKCGPIT